MLTLPLAMLLTACCHSHPSITAGDALHSVLSFTPSSFTPQAMLFTVCWRYLEEKMAERARKAKAA